MTPHSFYKSVGLCCNDKPLYCMLKFSKHFNNCWSSVGENQLNPKPF